MSSSSYMIQPNTTASSDNSNSNSNDAPFKCPILASPNADRFVWSFIGLGAFGGERVAYRAADTSKGFASSRSDDDQHRTLATMTKSNVPLVYQIDWLKQFNASSRYWADAESAGKIIHLTSDTNKLSRASLLSSLAASYADHKPTDGAASYDLSGGVLLCRAMNSRGWQKDPCAIVLTGRLP